MGSNYGLAPLEQAWRVCRAMMAFDPSEFDRYHTAIRQQFFLELKEGGNRDSWTEIIFPDGGKWYTFVSSDGWGKSKPSLSSGEEIGHTIHVTNDVKVSKQLKTFFSGYESGIHYNDAFLELTPRYHPLMLRESQNYEYPKDGTKEIISKIKTVILALDETYNKNKINEFRNRLQEQTVEVLKSRDTKPNVCTLESLIEFKRNLGTKRMGYGIDVNLYGSIMGITDLCMLYTIEKHKISTNRFDQKAFTTFNKLTYPLSSGDIEHPVTIFGQIINIVVQENGFDILKKFISSYEEQMLKRIELGLSSNDLDHHLNYLFDATNYCFPIKFMALQVYGTKGIPKKERDYFRRQERRFDEILVRLIVPFNYQIMDFNDDVWELHRRIIDYLKSNKEQKAVEVYLKRIIEEFWIYPRAFKKKLLEIH